MLKIAHRSFKQKQVNCHLVKNKDKKMLFNITAGE